MRARALAGVVIVAALMSVGASAAHAVTIGALPSSEPSPCTIGETVWLAQTKAASADYAVPAGGGAITAWSTAFGEPGSGTGLLVFAQAGGKLSVLAGDAQTLPAPAPADHVNTFTLASPIVVQPGDLLGLYSPKALPADCIFAGTGEDEISAGTLAGFPASGTALTPLVNETGYLLDVSAEIQLIDGALAQSITPSNVVSGTPSVIKLTPTFTPVSAIPSTITDTLPTGLQLVAASASPGTCTAAGQTVTCQVGAEAGASVVIVVTAATTGTFTNSASLSIAPFTDANPTDNSASAALNVTAPAGISPGPPAVSNCRPFNLAGVKRSLAETIFKALDCTIGKVGEKSSKKVGKGLLISNSPSSGSLTAGAAISLVVSSGKPKQAKHKAKRKH
jgi:hypothetical protein